MFKSLANKNDVPLQQVLQLTSYSVFLLPINSLAHQRCVLFELINYIFCKLFCTSSKHLLFLSVQTVHHIHVRTIFHLLSFSVTFPSLFHLLSTPLMLPGFTHLISFRLMNILHSSPILLQCKKIWLIISAYSPHKKHLETNW